MPRHTPQPRFAEELRIRVAESVTWSHTQGLQVAQTPVPAGFGQRRQKSPVLLPKSPRGTVWVRTGRGSPVSVSPWVRWPVPRAALRGGHGAMCRPLLEAPPPLRQPHQRHPHTRQRLPLPPHAPELRDRQRKRGTGLQGGR